MSTVCRPGNNQVLVIVLGSTLVLYIDFRIGRWLIDILIYEGEFEFIPKI